MNIRFDLFEFWFIVGFLYYVIIYVKLLKVIFCFRNIFNYLNLIYFGLFGIFYVNRWFIFISYF